MFPAPISVPLIKRVYTPSTVLEEPTTKSAKIKKEYPDLNSLVRNSHKAIRDSHDPSYRINSVSLLPPIDHSSCENRNVSVSKSAVCGKRSNMEDYVLLKETGTGILFCVFDGHGGSDVAELAKDYFEENFESKLAECNGNVAKAITLIGKMIDQQLAEYDEDGADEWNKQGSTAGINYYDKQKGLIYTATLGDSEAVLYRQIDEVWTAIPLSCIRNWESEKDRQRAEAAIKGTIEVWGNLKGKHLRYPPAINRFAYCARLNVSRSFGDLDINKLKENKLINPVSSKFKMTVQKVLPGDVIVAGSDGLWDVVGNGDIIKEIGNSARQLSAAALSSLALEKGSKDNISVVTLQIIPKMPQRLES